MLRKDLKEVYHNECSLIYELIQKKWWRSNLPERTNQQALPNCAMSKDRMIFKLKNCFPLLPLNPVPIFIVLVINSRTSGYEGLSFIKINWLIHHYYFAFCSNAFISWLIYLSHPCLYS